MKHNSLRIIAVVIILFAGMNLLYAEEQESPKAARSVHLFYPAPEGTVFYNEMVIDESHAGSYFMACGFSQGYYGLQEINDAKDKVVIFSVWEPGEQDNPNTVAEDRRVKVLYEGEGVQVSRFGNEGTGGKSIFPYSWKTGETYKFLVASQRTENRTIYSGYFYLNQEKTWKHLVSFSTLTKDELLKGYYSFVEDFRRDGASAKEIRKARYGNIWILSKDGNWAALTKAVFSADKTTLTNNINAGLLDNTWFYLQTGGETKNETALRSVLSRTPAGLVLPDLENKK